MIESITPERRSEPKLLVLSMIGEAALWGVFILMMPFSDVVVNWCFVWIPLMIWRGVLWTKRYGFRSGTVLPVAVIAGIVLGGMSLPAKRWFLDQQVGPLPAVSTFHDVRLALREYKLRYWYPEEMEATQLKMPAGRISLRVLMQTIDSQTGLHHVATKFCGTGASLLMNGGLPDTVVALQSKRVSAPLSGLGDR